MFVKTNFDKWLSRKIYLATIGMYASIVLLVCLRTIFIMTLGKFPLWAMFLSFLVSFTFDIIYERLVVYEETLPSINISKIILLIVSSTSFKTCASFVIDPVFGYFSIPILVLLSHMFCDNLKTNLWANHKAGANGHRNFFSKLPAKLHQHNLAVYGFYLFFIAMTLLAYKEFHFNSYFFYIFGSSCILATFEEIYKHYYVYDRKLVAKTFILASLWTSLGGIVGPILIWFLIYHVGFQGELATIGIVIVLKLIQPIGLIRFFGGIANFFVQIHKILITYLL